MSVRCMSWVWEHSQAVGNDRLVLLAIADRANDDGSDAWPSQESLCQKTRLSRRTVQRSIADLQHLGELEVDFERGRVNRYRVRMEPRLPLDVSPAEWMRQSDAGVNLTQGVRHPDARQIDTSVTGDAGDAPLLAHKTSSTSNTHSLTSARARTTTPTPAARIPVIGRGETLKFDQQQARRHAGHHPEVCRHRDASVQRCLPAAMVDQFAEDQRLIDGCDEVTAIAAVIAWARTHVPAMGENPDPDEFRYWRRVRAQDFPPPAPVVTAAPKRVTATPKQLGELSAAMRQQQRTEEAARLMRDEGLSQSEAIRRAFA